MVKIRISISIDYDIWMLAKEQTNNLSELINNFLKDVIENKKPEVKEYFDFKHKLLEAKKEVQQLSNKKELLNNEVKKKTIICCDCESDSVTTMVNCKYYCDECKPLY